MKTSNQLLLTGLKLTLGLISLALLSSCSNTKSSTTNPAAVVPNGIFTGSKILAQCNRTADTNFTFNTATAKDSYGNYQSDIIKMKISYISAAAAASGNTIKFFKWRVGYSGSEIDQVPLNFYLYNYSTGVAASSTNTSVATNQINQSTGFYITLNDPSYIYQVIKAVVYDANGAVVANVNSLIPGFYASPEDYKLNPDGTARAGILQTLHPLYGQSVAGWSSTQFDAVYNQYCF